MKVGMVTAYLSRDSAGVWEVVRALAANLTRADVEAPIFGLEPRASAHESGAMAQHSGRGFAVRGPASFGYAPGLGPALQAADLDVIHCHGLWMYPSLSGYRWSQQTGRPHLITPHGMLDGWALRHSRWKKRLAGCWFEDSHLRVATVLHALCEEELLSLRRLGLTNPVALIPNGIDLPPSRPPGPAPWSDRVKSGRQVLLFLGRLHEKKNLDALLRAFSRLHREYPPVREWLLVIAGWGALDYTRRVQALAESLHLEDASVFLGPLYDYAKHAAFAHADAFVLPSLSEGLPLAVLEAWSYGLPVLITDACNLTEGFSRGAALRIQGQPDGLAYAIKQIVGMSESERREMGANGRRLVLQRYCWSRVADEFVEVYRWLLAGGTIPNTIHMP